LSRGAVADSLLDTLGLISQECRKVGVFCLAIGQNFSGAIFPTGVRNCFVSMLSCRTRRDVARVMSGSTEFAKLAEGVSIGQVVWQTPAGELHRVAVPNTTERHLTLVAKQLEANGPFVVASTPTTYEPGYQQATARLPLGLQVPAEVAENGDDGSLLVATEDDSGSQAEATPEAKAITITDAKVAHAKRLLDQHVSFPEIIQQVWGVTSSQGRKYQAARTELESIIYSLWGKA
jgi:hypothetical protein